MNFGEAFIQAKEKNAIMLIDWGGEDFLGLKFSDIGIKRIFIDVQGDYTFESELSNDQFFPITSFNYETWEIIEANTIDLFVKNLKIKRIEDKLLQLNEEKKKIINRNTIKEVI